MLQVFTTGWREARGKRPDQLTDMLKEWQQRRSDPQWQNLLSRLSGAQTASLPGGAELEARMSQLGTHEPKSGTELPSPSRLPGEGVMLAVQQCLPSKEGPGGGAWGFTHVLLRVSLA